MKLQLTVNLCKSEKELQVHSCSSSKPKFMNLKSKWKALEKRPDFIAIGGCAILTMFVVLYKIGAFIGHFVFTHFGK
jgi:hypothetical protein